MEEHLGEDEPVISEEEKADLERIEILGRMVANHHTKIFDLGKRRATDIKGLNSIKLPGPLTISEGAKLGIRQETLREIFKDYRDENCGEGGEQDSNLNQQQRLGLKTLKLGIKKGELLVAETDKSGKFVVCSRAAYLEMASVHTRKDREID